MTHVFSFATTGCTGATALRAGACFCCNCDAPALRDELRRAARATADLLPAALAGAAAAARSVSVCICAIKDIVGQTDLANRLSVSESCNVITFDSAVGGPQHGSAVCHALSFPPDARSRPNEEFTSRRISCADSPECGTLNASPVIVSYSST